MKGRRATKHSKHRRVIGWRRVEWTDETSQFDPDGYWAGEMRLRDVAAIVPSDLSDDQIDDYCLDHPESYVA